VHLVVVGVVHEFGHVVRFVHLVLARHELDGAHVGAVTLVNLTHLDFLGYVALVEFVALLVDAVVQDLKELVGEVDQLHLPRVDTTHQDASIHRVELHARYFVLSLNGVERVHLVESTPERNFLGAGPTE